MNKSCTFDYFSAANRNFYKRMVATCSSHHSGPKITVKFLRNVFWKYFSRWKRFREKIHIGNSEGKPKFCKFWIPLVLRFFQWFFHSTPSNSVLRELLNPGGCLGTPPAPPPPPAPAGCSPLVWLPRNPQFCDLSQRVIHWADVFITLRVTGDVTLDSGSQWRHATCHS